MIKFDRHLVIFCVRKKNVYLIFFKLKLKEIEKKNSEMKSSS